MSHPLVEQRRAQQTQRVETARRWAERLAGRLDVVAVVVIGSTARGDFNKWSDIDVLVVAAELPARALDRLELLMRDTPAGLQPVGWTPADLAVRRSRRDPMAREADGPGITVLGVL